MIEKRFFTILSDPQIRKLPGGQKSRKFYYIGILNGHGGEIVNIVRGRLLNQRGTQWTRAGYPAGYEPFETCYGERWFSLATATIPVPRLTLAPGRPRIIYDHRPACILRTAPNSEQHFILRQAAARFKLEHEVRRATAHGSEEFSVAVDLLRPSRERGTVRHISEDMAECFEAYLALAETAKLRDLVALQRMSRPDDHRERATVPSSPGLFLVA